MQNVLNFGDRKRPTNYTVHITQHYDGRMEFWFEDVADDDRSREAIADAMETGAKLLRGSP